MANLKTTSRLWGFTFYAVIAILLVFAFNTDLKVPALLQIEFSDNWNQFVSLVSEYSYDRLFNNTLLDFGFIVIYSLLFYLSVKVMALSMGFKVNKWIYVFCFVPGIFDLVENFSLLYFIGNLTQEQNFTAFYWAVRIKWFLVIAFFLINLTILFYYGLVLFGRYYNLIFGKSKKVSRE